MCKNIVSFRFGFVDEDYGYVIDFGLLILLLFFFGVDLEIKVEVLWVGECLLRCN